MQDDDDIEIIVGTTKHCILDGTISSGLGFVIQVRRDYFLQTISPFNGYYMILMVTKIFR